MNVFIRSTIGSMAILSCLFSYTATAMAELKKIGPADDKSNNSVSVAKIYFMGSVDEQNSNKLIQAIDDANINYPNLKRIYFYLKSYGGDMDSGYAAYWAVKSSRTPVTAVNLATVMSSASMIFCGAKERLSLKGGRFILHAASILGDKYSFQPDQLKIRQLELNSYNEMFARVYKECTNFEDKEISSILHSENQRAFLLPEDAINKGMISGVADKIIDAPVSYYITDTDQK